MPLTMSSDSKQLILFLLSFIFTLHFHCHIALSSSSSFSRCSLSPSPLFCSPYSPFPSSPLDIFNYEIPSINVNLDSLIDEFSGAPCRRSMAVTDPEGDGVPEEEPQSTTLWPITHRHHFPEPLWLYILFNCLRQGPMETHWPHQCQPENEPSLTSATGCKQTELFQLLASKLVWLLLPKEKKKNTPKCHSGGTVAFKRKDWNLDEYCIKKVFFSNFFL